MPGRVQFQSTWFYNAPAHITCNHVLALIFTVAVYSVTFLTFQTAIIIFTLTSPARNFPDMDFTLYTKIFGVQLVNRPLMWYLVPDIVSVCTNSEGCMTNEEIQNKIARMFNMGAYGDLLAQALLYEYAHNLAEELRTSETLRDWTDDHMGDVELAATWIDPWS